MTGGGNGRNPPTPAVLVGETSVVIHVLHFADGRASSDLHVTFGGTGHLEQKPKVLATIMREHAAEVAGRSLLLPPGTTGV